MEYFPLLAYQRMIQATLKKQRRVVFNILNPRAPLTLLLIFNRLKTCHLCMQGYQISKKRTFGKVDRLLAWNKGTRILLDIVSDGIHSMYPIIDVVREGWTICMEQFVVKKAHRKILEGQRNLKKTLWAQYLHTSQSQITTLRIMNSYTFKWFPAWYI